MKKVILSLVIALFALPAFADEYVMGLPTDRGVKTPKPVVEQSSSSVRRGGYTVLNLTPTASPIFQQNGTLYFGMSQFSRCRLEYKDGTVIKGVVGTGQALTGKAGTATLLCHPVRYNEIPKEYGVNQMMFFYSNDWDKDYNLGEVVIK